MVRVATAVCLVFCACTHDFDEAYQQCVSPEGRCATAGDGGTSQDAGIDAGVTDAGVTDAGVDAGTDAGVYESGCAAFWCVESHDAGASLKYRAAAVVGSEVWFGGNPGAVRRRTDAGVFAALNVASMTDVNALAVRGSRVWIAGTDGNNGRLRFSDPPYSTVSSNDSYPGAPIPGYLFGLWISPTAGFCVGSAGQMYALAAGDAGTWSAVPPVDLDLVTAGLQTEDLYAVHGNSSGDVWAVGRNGVALHRQSSDGGWVLANAVDEGPGVFYEGVHVFEDGTVYMAGCVGPGSDNCRIRFRAASDVSLHDLPLPVSWRGLPSPQIAITDLAGEGTLVWVTATTSKIAVYDTVTSQWTEFESPDAGVPDEHVREVLPIPGTPTVFVVGDGQLVLRH